VGTAIAAISFFYFGVPGKSNDSSRVAWQHAKQADTAKAYIQALADTPTHYLGIGYQFKAQRRLNKLAVASLQGSCPMDELAFYSRELFGQLSLAERLTPTAEMMGLTLRDTDQAGAENEVRLDFTTEVIRDTYTNTAQPGIFYTRNAGRKLEGTVTLGSSDPQSLSYTYHPNSIFKTSESELEKDSLKIVFNNTFRPAFTKLLISECTAPAIAAFYLDFREPGRIQQRPHFKFVRDGTIDDYLLANLDDVLPVLMSVAANDFTSAGARKHVAVLFLQTNEQDRLLLISALLHSSRVAHDSAIRALINIDSPDSLPILMNRGICSYNWSLVDINGAWGRPLTTLDTYLKSKAGTEIANMVVDNASKCSDSTIAALLEWTIADSSRPIYSQSDEPRILNWLASEHE